MGNLHLRAISEVRIEHIRILDEGFAGFPFPFPFVGHIKFFKSNVFETLKRTGIILSDEVKIGADN